MNGFTPMDSLSLLIRARNTNINTTTAYGGLQAAFHSLDRQLFLAAKLLYEPVRR